MKASARKHFQFARNVSITVGFGAAVVSVAATVLVSSFLLPILTLVLTCNSTLPECEPEITDTEDGNEAGEAMTDLMLGMVEVEGRQKQELVRSY